MVNTRELIAIISTGTSIYRVTLYFLVFTLVYYFLLVIFIQDKIIFPAYQKALIYKEVIFERADIEQLERLKDNRNFSIFGSNNLLYIVSYYNAVTKQMTDITLVQFFDEDIIEETNTNSISNQNLWMTTNVLSLDAQRRLLGDYAIRIKMRVDADSAYWDSAQSNWVFKNGTIRYMEVGGVNTPEEDFVSESFNFISDPPQYFEKIWYPVDAMTTKESREYVQRLKQAHQDWKESEAHRFSKYGYPIGVLFVVLAGIGIVNIASRKSSFILNIILSLGLFILYYVMFASGLALAGKGVISPAAGAFTGTICFFVISLFLYTRAKT